MPCTAFCAQGGELGALTLTPGIYESAPGTFAITNGDLTLDAQGDANAVWVFQMGTSLTVGLAATPRSVILINGAQAKNVFCTSAAPRRLTRLGAGPWWEASSHPQASRSLPQGTLPLRR